MAHTFFVTGTDTDVGKTLVTTGLLLAAKAKGLQTMGLKPIAAGCEQTTEGLRNDDALQIQQAMTTTLSYEQINPVTLEPAIAPHIAAEQAGRRISIDRLVGICRGAFMQRADFTVVEGAGGWRVPVSYRETLASLPKQLNLPVILVVGIRLGCLNHALLTAEAIRRDGLPIAGWVANRVDPNMDAADESVATLCQMLPAPLLGDIPFLSNPTGIDIQKYVDIDKLLV